MLKKSKVLFLTSGVLALTGGAIATGVVLGTHNRSASSVPSASPRLDAMQLADRSQSQPSWVVNSIYRYQDSVNGSTNTVERVLSEYPDAITYASNLAFPLRLAEGLLPALPAGYSWDQTPTLSVKYGNSGDNYESRSLVASPGGRFAWLAVPYSPAPSVASGDTLKAVYFVLDSNGKPDGRFAAVNFELTDKRIYSGQGTDSFVTSSLPILEGFDRYSLLQQLEELPPVNYGYEDWSGPYVSLTKPTGFSANLYSFSQVKAGDKVVYTYVANPKPGSGLRAYSHKVEYGVIKSKFSVDDLQGGRISAFFEYDYSTKRSFEQLKSEALQYVSELASLYDFSFWKQIYGGSANTYIDPSTPMPLPAGQSAVFFFTGIPTKINAVREPLSYTAQYDFKVVNGVQGRWNTYKSSRKVHIGHKFLNFGAQLDEIPAPNPGYKPWVLENIFTYQNRISKPVSEVDELIAGGTLWYVYTTDPFLPNLQPYKIRIGYDLLERTVSDDEIENHVYVRSLQQDAKPGINRDALIKSTLGRLDGDLGELYVFQILGVEITDENGRPATWDLYEAYPAGYHVSIKAIGMPTRMNSDSAPMRATVNYEMVTPYASGTDVEVYSDITLQPKSGGYYDLSKLPDQPPPVKRGYRNWFSYFKYQAPNGPVLSYFPLHDSWQPGGVVWRIFSTYAQDGVSLRPYEYRVGYRVVESEVDSDRIQAAIKGELTFLTKAFAGPDVNIAALKRQAERLLIKNFGPLYDLSYVKSVVTLADGSQKDPSIDEPVVDEAVPSAGRYVAISYVGKPTVVNAIKSEAKLFVLIRIEPPYVQGISVKRLSTTPIAANLHNFDLFSPPEGPPVQKLGWYDNWSGPVIEQEDQNGRRTPVGSVNDLRSGGILWYRYLASVKPGAPLQPYSYEIGYQLLNSEVADADISVGTYKVHEGFSFEPGFTPSFFRADSALRMRGLVLEGLYSFSFTKATVYNPQGTGEYFWGHKDLPIGYRFITEWKGIPTASNTIKRDFKLFIEYEVRPIPIPDPGRSETLPAIKHEAGSAWTAFPPAAKGNYSLVSTNYYGFDGAPVELSNLQTYAPGQSFKIAYVFKPDPNYSGPEYTITQPVDVVAGEGLQTRYVIEDRTSYVENLTTGPNVPIPVDNGYSKYAFVNMTVIANPIPSSLSSKILISRYVVTGADKVPYYVEVRSRVLSASLKDGKQVIEQGLANGPRSANGLPDAHLPNVGSEYTQWYLNKAEIQVIRGKNAIISPNGYYWNYPSGSVLFITYIAFSNTGKPPLLFTIVYQL